MTLKLVICPHCGFKFRTDIEAQVNVGTANVWRHFLNFYNTQPRKVTFIELLCPNPKCKKTIEYKVE